MRSYPKLDKIGDTRSYEDTCKEPQNQVVQLKPGEL